MKKVLVVTTIALLLCMGFVAFQAQGDKPETKGNGIDLTGAHYNLNLLCKKSDWNQNSFDNPDRHTMFIPEDTKAKDENGDYIFSYQVGNSLKGLYEGAIQIEMRQAAADEEGATDFEVIDGSAFDNDIDSYCALELPKAKKYAVYLCCKGKPLKDDQDPAMIEGWTYLKDSMDLEYYLLLGYVTPKKQWEPITDMFYIEASQDPTGYMEENELDEMWIFEYFDAMEWYEWEVQVGVDPMTGEPIYETVTMEDMMYFWNVMNNGNKIFKVRFYEVGTWDPTG
jgi:hypothetical protein